MKLLSLLLAIVSVPAVLVVYIYITEKLIGGRSVRLLPAAGPRSGRAGKSGGAAFLRPWLWLLPSLLLLGVFLLYPVVNTIILSFKNARSIEFVGLANFIHIFTDRGMLIVLRNNVAWLVFFTAGTLGLGLLMAVLSDKVRWEPVAKAAVFIPMAISFVAAGVIWRFMFEFRPAGEVQIGTVNAVLTALIPGFQPRAWLFDKQTNNIALIVVGIWMWTGFAMVILSAGLKGIPTDVIEAARIDGASAWQIFVRIILPLAAPTIAVVATTLMVNVLKIFDIVYVMTNGSLGTEVIANRMYKELFNYRHFGRASAIAVILLVAIAPVMIMNIKRFKESRKSHG
ncbi:MAG: sugar ABC transporter permease [Spirochaetes bacterium]|nr:sugar ABC transporter permease [Spirochaetota bacterium]MBU0955759.1 sugar ABC transporter permease [Spirochaetota bacterium]